MPEIDRARLIEAEWEEGVDTTLAGDKFEAEIVIYANDRSGLLNDVSRIFTESGISIIGINTRTSKQGIATMEVNFPITGKSQLNDIIAKLRQVKNVIDIQRNAG
jgi:GTP pyrophosphokinase